jgi:TrmH family RNA methyltransferase
VSHGGPEALGPRHNEIKRLRGLLRDPAARAAESVFVLEGPKLVADALRRGVVFDSIFFGPNARSSFRSVLDLPDGDDVAVFDLKEGVLEKLGSTRTPQPVLAVAVIPRRPQVTDLDGDGPVLVAVGVSDPGNLGTLLRSAEASGCAGVVCCGDSVDVYNPKVVRASAGSVMGIPIVERRGTGGAGEAGDPVPVLEELAAAGRSRFGAATGGVPAYEVNLAVPVAFVLGNEAHGLSARVLEHVDGLVAIPMAGEVESLNVAMAGSVLAFEAARQRSAR